MAKKPKINDRSKFRERPLSLEIWPNAFALRNSLNSNNAILSQQSKRNSAVQFNLNMKKAKENILNGLVKKATSTSSKNYGSGIGGANYGNFAGMSGYTAGSSRATGSNNIYDLQAMNDYNNWLNIQMMREQNAFNAQQAQLQRDFEQNMSNTAHQRQVSDLKAAGLNPVLSANAGASTPVGSSAMSGNWVGADTSTVSALAQVLAATLGANAQMTAAGINAAASRDVAGINLAGTEYSANKSYSSAKYQADKNYKGQLYSAGIYSAGNIIDSIIGLANPKQIAYNFGSYR